MITDDPTPMSRTPKAVIPLLQVTCKLVFESSPSKGHPIIFTITLTSFARSNWSVSFGWGFASYAGDGKGGGGEVMGCGIRDAMREEIQFGSSLFSNALKVSASSWSPFRHTSIEQVVWSHKKVSSLLALS